MIPIRQTLLILAVLLITVSVPADAQDDPYANPTVSWKLLTPTISGTPGQVVNVKVQAAIEAGYHLYTTKTYPPEALAPSRTFITVGEKVVVTQGGSLQGPKPTEQYDENFEIATEFWTGTITLTVPVKIVATARPGMKQAWVSFNFMTCNDQKCIPPTDKKFNVTVNIKSRKKSTR